MILGVGVDMVTISEIARFAASPDDAFVRRTFTPGELRAAERSARPGEYLAARFAAKEAVFKAIAHLTKAKTFDFRIVETLSREDGSPYVNTSGTLAPLLREAGVERLHISITTEGDYATAFVIAS